MATSPYAGQVEVHEASTVNVTRLLVSGGFTAAIVFVLCWTIGLRPHKGGDSCGLAAGKPLIGVDEAVLAKRVAKFVAAGAQTAVSALPFLPPLKRLAS